MRATSRLIATLAALALLALVPGAAHARLRVAASITDLASITRAATPSARFDGRASDIVRVISGRTMRRAGNCVCRCSFCFPSEGLTRARAGRHID